MGQIIMLVLLIFLATTLALLAEMAFRELSKHYEIEWVPLNCASTSDLAADVVVRLRKAQAKLNAR